MLIYCEETTVSILQKLREALIIFKETILNRNKNKSPVDLLCYDPLVLNLTVVCALGALKKTKVSVDASDIIKF